MLSRSVNAANARQSGSARKMTAITMKETPVYSNTSRRRAQVFQVLNTM
jgi:hypothetical protein